MKRIFMILLSVLAMSIAGPAQEQNEDARDIFLGSRRKKTGQAPPQAGPKPSPQPGSGGRQNGEPPISDRRRPRKERPGKNNSGAPPSSTTVDTYPASTIGLGYTVFLKDNQTGAFFRVNPNRIFSTGQSIRLLVESNMDGYLYLFHQEDGGPVKLLYPAWDAREGDNRIWAHYPMFVPDPSLYELAFTRGAAVENFTIVVSRTPLPGVPTGTKLRGLGSVPINGGLFREIIRPETYREYHGVGENSVMTDREGSRDVEMVKSDPPPAHIILNRHAIGERVVTKFKLEHR